MKHNTNRRDFIKQSALTAVILSGSSSSIAAAEPGSEKGSNPVFRFEEFAKIIKGRGTPDRIPKWNTATTIIDSIMVENNGNIGIGVTTPGEKLHLGDGNFLIEGGGETAIKIKRDVTFTGGPSGTSPFPIFQIGRIIRAGDGDPELRFIYSDDNTPEQSVFEIDRKGIAASVKPDRGSHFEGFISGTDPEPIFRLNSFPKMRLEMGNGGSTPVDVVIQREAAATLTFLTGNAERVRIDANGNVGIGTANPSATLEVRVGGTTLADAWTVRSSARFKQNVQTLQQALPKVLQLRGVTFDWKETNRPSIGFIAEEVASVLPEAVEYETNGRDAKGLDYNKLMPVLVEAIKTQQQKIEEFQQQNAKLEMRNAEQEKRLAALEAMVKAMVQKP